MTSDRRILIVTSDWHSGHRLGLMNPETVLYEQLIDGKSKDGISKLDYTLGEYQNYLWHDIWLPSIDKINQIADGSPVGMTVNGDITHGNKYPDQLVTTSMANQFLIAEGCIKPWLEQVPGLNFVRFAIGTGSHIFNESTSPVIVSELLRPKYPDVNIGVVHHGLVHAGGVKIDYAHHGPSQGIREWTKGNQLRYYLKSIMSASYRNGDKPPDAVFRSHYHYPHREIVTEYQRGDQGRPYTIESRIYLTPSMCGMNDYAQQASRSAPTIYNGFMVLEIENGQIVNDHLDDFVWVLDLRTEDVW
jgi:hypothetical protein